MLVLAEASTTKPIPSPTVRKLPPSMCATKGSGSAVTVTVSVLQLVTEVHALTRRVTGTPAGRDMGGRYSADVYIVAMSSCIRSAPSRDHTKVRPMAGSPSSDSQQEGSAAAALSVRALDCCVVTDGSPPMLTAGMTQDTQAVAAPLAVCPWEQSAQAVAESGEKRPWEQAVQEVAAILAFNWYPAGQDSHPSKAKPTVGSANCPAGQAVQDVAATAAFRWCPAGHGSQLSKPLALYCPAEHAVHVEAPAPSGTLVSYPKPQSVHSESTLQHLNRSSVVHASSGR